MNNSIKRGPIGNCIALHDIAKKNIDFKAWTSYVVALFRQYGIEPTKVDMTGPNGVKGRKNITFKNALKRLEQCHYTGIDTIWIGSPQPGCDVEMLDSIFTARIGMNLKRTYDALLCVDDSIFPFEESKIDSILRDLGAILKPQYGYVFQRPFTKGPDFYPCGVIVGLDFGNEERRRITKWLDAYEMSDGSYKTGDLRDIYLINILSPAHQARQIEGQGFFDWIAAEPKRGSLIPLIENELWSWHVPTEQIPFVQESLRSTGWILCLRDDIYPMTKPTKS